MRSKAAILLLVCCNCFANAVIETQPQQIHLSWGPENGNGDYSTIMVVTWVTGDETNQSIVEYGENDLRQIASGTEELFTVNDGAKPTKNRFIHRVWLRDLKPGHRYVYHCGSYLGWSEIYDFIAMKAGTNWTPRFAVFGDLGNVNGKSIARLQEETERGHFDGILHVGDFAYNMDTEDGNVGDAFMNQIQSIAAYVPYMTCVGNHEEAYNFTHYVNRFTMPGGDGHNLFYSFNVGPAHIIGFSSEFYYFIEYGFQQIINQYRWLERDLQEANKPENRAIRPWIVTMCHRPLYCSNSNDPEHCTNLENLIRVGFPEYDLYSMEELLYKYGVDLHFQAHEHSYERMWPVYNLTVCNGSTADPYRNPQAPVHIVTGSGGCQEGVDPFLPVTHPWSAFHSDDYGYTRLTILNGTHLYMEQVSDDQDGKVIDKMTLIKDVHGAGLYNCPSKSVPSSMKKGGKNIRPSHS